MQGWGNDYLPIFIYMMMMMITPRNQRHALAAVAMDPDVLRTAVAL